MSVLDWPRINFRGIFRTNPSTSNNDDVMPDIVDRDTNTLGSTVAGMSDAQVRAYLRERVTMADFGTDTPCHPFLRSGWNLFGDFMTNLDNALVTSYVDEHGALSTDHPLVGARFKLLGAKGSGSTRRVDPAICDLDPTGLVTTQIWIGGAAFTSADGQALGGWDHDTRAYQNWLAFNATVGEYAGEQNFVSIGCLFQFSIPPQACAAALAAGASDALRTLLQHGAAAGGLSVRFQVFECEPAVTDNELFAVFQQGQGIANPCFGYAIGTVGVHGLDEPSTEPAGRKLCPPIPRPPMCYRSPTGDPSTCQQIPGAPLPWAGPPALLGNVVVKVRQQPAVITLDLVNAFPKWGFRHPSGPPVPYDPNDPAPGFQQPVQRADVGDLVLVCDMDNRTVVLGTLNYGLEDYAGWEARGGLQDMPYDGSLYEAICAGNLRIVSTHRLNVGVTMLEEELIRVVTDDRGVYVAGPGAEFPVTLRAYERGGPLTRPLTLYPVEYANIIQTDPPGATPPYCAPERRPNQTTQQRSQIQPPPDGEARVRAMVDGQEVSSLTLQPGQSELRFTLRGLRAGAAVLNYQRTTEVMAPSVPAWSSQVYSSVRVFTGEDYHDVIGRGDIPWDYVYEQTLRYYYLLFPFMSTIIPLNAPSAILRYADLILERLGTPEDPVFWTSHNMPATHTMSPGKVKLLRAWIAQERAKGSSSA